MIDSVASWTVLVKIVQDKAAIQRIDDNSTGVAGSKQTDVWLLFVCAVNT
jgi:hypothetical protein